MPNDTKTKIIESFLELASEKDFSKIKVMEVVEKSNSTRQTFYYYFKNIDDLADKMLDEEFENLYRKFPNCTNWLESANDFCEVFYKYECFFRNAIYGNSCLWAYNKIKLICNSYIKEYIASRKNPKEFGDFFYECCAYSLSGMIIQELKAENADFKKMMLRAYKKLKTTIFK